MAEHRVEVDFVTNPTFPKLMGEFNRMLRAERIKLESLAGGQDMGAVNVQLGKIRGIEHAIRLCDNFRDEALEQDKVADAA